MPSIYGQYEFQVDGQRTCVQEAWKVQTIHTTIGFVTSKVGRDRIEPTFGNYNKHLTRANIDNPYPISCAQSKFSHYMSDDEGQKNRMRGYSATLPAIVHGLPR